MQLLHSHSIRFYMLYQTVIAAERGANCISQGFCCAL